VPNEAGNARINRPVPNALLDKTVLAVFRFIDHLARLRSKYPRIAKVLVGGASFGISSAIWLLFIFPWVQTRFAFAQSEMEVIRRAAVTIIGSLVTAIVIYPLLRLCFQFALMARRSIAMYALGLEWLSTDGGDIHRLLAWYLGQHPEAEQIRVICISGDSLFGENSATPKGQLKNWANRGNLDVIMPVSSADNATVQERFATYSGETRGNYPTVEHLVNEMRRTKEQLALSQFEV
jgi:hypothetical protein